MINHDFTIIMKTFLLQKWRRWHKLEFNGKLPKPVLGHFDTVLVVLYHISLSGPFDNLAWDDLYIIHNWGWWWLWWCCCCSLLHFRKRSRCKNEETESLARSCDFVQNWISHKRWNENFFTPATLVATHLQNNNNNNNNILPWNLTRKVIANLRWDISALLSWLGSTLLHMALKMTFLSTSIYIALRIKGHNRGQTFCGT